LLYPHHFDLSLSWFPHNDKQQITLGWSTGDDTIPEPYLYLTVYPEAQLLDELELPEPAYRQTKGFEGAVLLYKDLAAHKSPVILLEDFAGLLTQTV
jgi:hypothetical protein